LSSNSSLSATTAALVSESSVSGSVSPSSSATSPSPSPENVAALLQQLQQSTTHQATATLGALRHNNTLLQNAVAAELKRAHLLKSQLVVLDKMAMAQAAADQQKAALLASSGMAIPQSLQQAAALNSLLLTSSLAAQALTPQHVGTLANAQAAGLVLSPQLNSLANNPLASMIAQQLNNGVLANTPAPHQTQSTPFRGPVQKVLYRDASLVPDPVVETKKGRAEPFPTKIHRMLSELEQQGKTDIASFLPHGRAFIIHKPKKFTEEIMPKYFRMSRFSSFQRQLNLCKSVTCLAS